MQWHNGSPRIFANSNVVRVQFLSCRDESRGYDHDEDRRVRYPSAEGRLAREFMQRRDDVSRLYRPLKNSTDTIRVHFNISLMELLEVNEKDQMITTRLWKVYVSMRSLQRLCKRAVPVVPISSSVWNTNELHLGMYA